MRHRGTHYLRGGSREAPTRRAARRAASAGGPRYFAPRALREWLGAPLGAFTIAERELLLAVVEQFGLTREGRVWAAAALDRKDLLPPATEEELAALEKQRQARALRARLRRHRELLAPEPSWLVQLAERLERDADV